MNKLPLLLLLLAGCSSEPLKLHYHNQQLMHTRWDFSAYARTGQQAQLAFREASEEVERLDGMLAMWKPESELARYNAAARKPRPSADLQAVMDLAEKARKESEGAFDPRVGGLVQLWYHALRKPRIPADAEIEKAMKSADLDFGAVAKGYAQDKAAAILIKHRLKAFIINAGGQVYAYGRKPDRKKWRVGVLHPGEKGKVIAIAELENQSMSTSSDAEQFTLVKGKRYGHILDPRTGRPAAKGSASATVIVPLKGHPLPGAWADCLSTAAFVLGPLKAKSFLERLNVSGVMVEEREGFPLGAIVTDDLDGKLEVKL